MDFGTLVKEYGPLAAALIIAVIALWKAFNAERKYKNTYLRRYQKLLEAREEELHDILKDQARKKLREIVTREKKKRGK